MGTVLTSRIGYSGRDGLDITVKSASGLGTALAPTWALVGGLKGWRGYEILTPTEYTERYFDLIRARYRTDTQPFMDILAQKRTVLLCFCRADSFCHRHLAVDILDKIALRNGIVLVRGGEIATP